MVDVTSANEECLRRMDAGEPVLVKVAAILRPILPDLPTPRTTIFCRLAKAATISSTAWSNDLVRCERTAFTAASSTSKTSRARLRWDTAGYSPFG